ncbi:MAG: hypothetical protein RMJ15_00720 [Nitrososphaerota archaeon]|nr:hypothetical protein [Candidatus Bathyarchaeota archaeon]MDW8022255.1 hypothetical protein [Nitrososphaerota archaeon]
MEMCSFKLNSLIRDLVKRGFKEFNLHNVFGQRYIGAGLCGNIVIKVHGTPGNDLGIFMNGPKMYIYGNVQDGCGNTMNDGLIVVYGNAGDVIGYSMRGGKIFIRGDVGYRAGIHMKGYQTTPALVIGGSAGDFLGEYMAGGVILLLELKRNGQRETRFAGTGMHGGVIYVRGRITHFGKGAKRENTEEKDLQVIHKLVKQFCDLFNLDFGKIMEQEFTKIVPASHRPYGKLYT